MTRKFGGHCNLILTPLQHQHQHHFNLILTPWHQFTTTTRTDTTKNKDENTNCRIRLNYTLVPIRKDVDRTSNTFKKLTFEKRFPGGPSEPRGPGGPRGPCLPPFPCVPCGLLLKTKDRYCSFQINEETASFFQSYFT